MLVPNPFVVVVPFENPGQRPETGATAELVHRCEYPVRLADVIHRMAFDVDPGTYDAFRHLVGGQLASADLRGSDPAMYDTLARAGLLLRASEAEVAHAYVHAEIEINSHCNYRCEFCPVSTDPHPRRIMAIEVFESLLGQLVEYGIRSVSLNHYSEPLLHPLFSEFAAFALESNLRVQVFTNGSALSDRIVEQLEGCEKLSLLVNIPDTSPGEYERITGRRLNPGLVPALERLAASGVACSAIVNLPLNNSSKRLRRVQDSFYGSQVSVVRWNTDDRAGRLKADHYAAAVTHQGRLAGCGLAAREISIDVHGEAFLCAQDYSKKVRFGSVLRDGLGPVVESLEAQRIRGAVFGVREASPDLICRRCAWTCARHALKDPLTIGSPSKGGGLVPAEQRNIKTWHVERVMDPGGDEPHTGHLRREGKR